VGGNIGFNTGNQKSLDGSVTTGKGSNFNLDLSPNVGKFLSEKVAVGIALNISFSQNTTGVNTETTTKASSIGASPFLRYYAVKWNKLALYGQGNLGFDLSNSSVTTGGSKSDGPKQTSLYLTLSPGLSYDVTEKLSLITSINIFNFGYNYHITKDGTTKTTSSNFNIGGGLGNIVSIGAISVGAYYKF
jgi:outer membrane protein